MTNSVEPSPTFKDFMFDFEWDTGLKAKENLPLYIEYYKAKVLEGYLVSIKEEISYLKVHLQQISMNTDPKKQKE